MIVGGPACVNTEAVTDPALPRPMSEDYQAPSGAGHPIPPPELVQQLRSEAPHRIRDTSITRELHLIAAAYRAGADQELEACVNYVDNTMSGNRARALRAARRPKPPSLADQGLAVLDDASDRLDAAHENTIRRALERLQELEGNGRPHSPQVVPEGRVYIETVRNAGVFVSTEPPARFRSKLLAIATELEQLDD